MPQQKASPSFADDLAALDAGSFADDLAALEQTPPEKTKEQKIDEFLNAPGPLGSLTRGAAQGGIMSIGPQALEGGRRVITGLARRMYQGALKPTKAVVDKTQGGEAALVDAGLREGLNVSRGGVKKATKIISELDDQVSAAIKGSPATVSRNAVSQRLNDTYGTFRNQVNPEGDLQQIRNVGRAFRRSQPSQIPVEKAQALKQGTYKAQAKKYGQQAGAEAEAEKALARGLKEEIGAAVPAVQPLNARSSSVIQVRKALNDATRRTGNRDTVGLTDIVAMGTNPKALLATVGMRALPQSMLARVLNRTGQSDITPEALSAAVRALLLGSTDQQQP